MAKQLISAIAFLMATLGVAEASNGFLCVADQATGFVEKDGEWKKTSFSPGKYVLVAATPKDNEFFAKAGVPAAEWVLKIVGTDVAWLGCVKGPTSMNCGNGDFFLNEENLRFVYTAANTYLFKKKLPKEYHATASLEIGTCSVF